MTKRFGNAGLGKVLDANPLPMFAKGPPSRLLRLNRDDVTQLVERTRWWEMLFDQNPIPMWVFDKTTLRFLAVNQEAIRHYGYSGEQFLAMTALDIRPPDDAVAFRKIVRTTRKKYRASRVWRHVKADGQIIHVSPHSCTIEFEGTEAELVALHDVTELKNAENYISYLATHDVPTALPNRLALTERLDALSLRARFSQDSFALLCVDLVQFSDVNQLNGASVGDSLLKDFANRVACLAKGAFVARLGGDRFGVILSGIETPAAATLLAERILSALRDEKEILGNELQVEACAGIAFYPHDGQDGLALVTSAEVALARARADGPGKLHAFDTKVERRLRETNALKRDLRMAIERDEFHLAYQPQTTITGEIVGFEALLRWHHPERGLVPPMEFIPLAEQSGQIQRIGKWVLRRACQDAASWKRPLLVAVNLSPIQVQDDELPAVVVQILKETALPPERLELEVTESTAFDDFSRANSALMRLKSLGIKIAIDDFGTGYSSLSYLRDFPVDKIKIDRSFMGSEQEQCKIVR